VGCGHYALPVSMVAEKGAHAVSWSNTNRHKGGLGGSDMDTKAVTLFDNDMDNEEKHSK